MNNVLVTGSQGFVGRHFVKRLLREGCRVTCIDDLSSAGTVPPAPQPGLVFMRVDARAFFHYSPTCEFDTIFHLAAVVGGRLKIDGDPLAVATDLEIDSAFFNWLARVPKKPEKVIYFSSSAAYPIWHQSREYSNALEESMCDFGTGYPDKTYGMAKLVGEYLASFACKQYDVPVVIYRPFSGYGPGQSFDYPFPSIVKRVMDSRQDTAELRSKRAVTVWGSGDQLRDFIYIGDVVDAVLETKDKLGPGEALNLGSGVGTSFRELAVRVAKVLGIEVSVINDPTKPEGVFARVADVTKFKRFYPKELLSLETGIERVIDDLTVGSA